MRSLGLELVVALTMVSDLAAAQPKAAPLAATRPASPPTLRTAGAKTCQLQPVVELGPDGGPHAVLGFDTATGIAAWRGKTDLAIAALELDGKRRGTSLHHAPIARGHEPYAVYPLGGRFVIITRLWDWEHHAIDWWGRVVDATGLPLTGEISLGLTGFDIATFAHVDERRLAVHAGPSSADDKAHPERWVILEVTSDVLVATPATTAPTLAPTASDAVSYAIANGARGGGRGPDGTIYEPMGRPMLERSRASKPVGDAILMEHHNNPIAHSMNVSPDIAWTGTHFVYPFTADDRQLLLPVSCKP